MAFKVLSRDEAKKLDEFAIQNKFISNEELMDNAGRLSAQFFLEKINNPFNKKILVLAGKGNNGGDAIIMYHYIKKYGVKTDLYIFDYTKSKQLMNHYNIPIKETLSMDNIDIFKSYDWYIDGIFGIGLNKPIIGKYKKIINLIKNKNVISLDIPSGIDCNTGKNISDDFVEPKFVLSMGNYKYSDIIHLGKKNFPRTKVLDIGLPDKDLCSAKLIESSDIKKIVKQDNLLRNKYDQSCNAIIGSKNYSGAAELSIKSAIASGAGYLKAFMPQKINNIISSNDGSVNNYLGKGDYLMESDLKEIFKLGFVKKNSPVLIGPGLGNKKTTSKLIQNLLGYIKSENSECVLDASGFEPLYTGMVIDDLPKKCIMTPHLGELKKIFHNSNTEDIIEFSKSIIPILNSRVLLIKGPVNIVITSKGDLLFINNGQSSLASAGSGDVLSGMIIAFLSRGYGVDSSTIIATYVHGLCSQIFSKKRSKYSMSPNDIIKTIPIALNELSL